jgi:clan AA aspartic protease (TIGR02281 family)
MKLIPTRIIKSTCGLIVLLFFVTAGHAQTVIKMEEQNGVYYMPCTVNGLPMKFIYDTGASDISISVVEALFMIKNGHLDEDDLIGTEYYRLANGEITEGTTINLKKIEIGDLVLENVRASIVHALEAPLLLGQSALSRLGSIEFDYTNSTLIVRPNMTSNSSFATTRSSATPVNSSFKSNNNKYEYTGMYLYKAIFNSPATNLSLRESASLESQIIVTLPKSSTLYVIDESDNVFAKVHAGGYTGFISKRFIKKRS